jgi:hypothetical protein
MELLAMLVPVLVAFYLGWLVGKGLENKKATAFLLELKEEVIGKTPAG